MTNYNPYSYKGEDALSIIQDDFRPWPRVRFTEVPSINYYKDLEKNIKAERDELRQYERRVDRNLYEPIFLDVLRLFGIAIHTSLERTLGKYLKATDGIFRNDLRSDWELSKVGTLLCTNNAAERPFGVAKGNARVYLHSIHAPSNMSTFPSTSSVYEYIPKLKFTYTGYFQSGNVHWVSSAGRIKRETKQDKKQRGKTMWHSFTSYSRFAESYYPVV